MKHDQQAFDLVTPGEPLFTLPPMPGARAARDHASTAVVIELLLARRDQIQRFGHTPEADRNLPLSFLPREARTRCNAMVEDIQFNRPRAQLRRQAIKAAALLIAFIDRLDADAAPDAADVAKPTERA